MKTTNKTKYISFLILSILIFSVFEIVSKTTTGSITTSQLTFYRFLIGGFVLLPFAIAEIRKLKIKLTFKDFCIFLILGFLLVFCSMNLSQLGIAYSNASMSAVIFSSNPLFISIFSVFLLGEKLTANKTIGLTLGIIGLICTCLHLFINPATSKNFFAGVLLIFLAMIVFSFYTVINKKLSKNYTSTITLSFASILGAIMTIPLLFLQSPQTNPFVFDLQPIIFQFLFLSIVGTGLAYYFYFTALANLNTSAGSLTFFVKPGIASILSAILLNEVITADIIIGIILILLGLYCSIRPKPIFKK